ncbi:class A beta-lactamase-related serine hydrolase [Streptomyces sp. PLK6-54]|uniref:Class A beta-lactamase-related serine hydrolase n=2 Tax=Actinacidiphila acidipaludis TaxID=2873382 RepID=A0ABS7Q016_9ACTN|nr:class A beta-lactamase-related serine hydrolase [Streptomyces acidipaludis]
MAVLTLATITQSPSARAGSDAKPAGATTGGAGSPPAPTATSKSAAPRASSSATPPTESPATSSTSPPTPTATATRSAATAVRRAIDALPADGDLAVAVTDLDDDADSSAAYDTSDDDGNTYDTASIVKVDILAALLLQAQHAGTRLTANERALAAVMIEQSDNDAATALWDAIGRAAGLDAANRTLGLDHTSPGSGELWGLTQTTPADQLTLLRAVFVASGSPLSSASRAYVAGLMGAVTATQTWGVSAADSDDAGYALKNGWLQRTQTGLWDVNSIGQVVHDGHRMLIAVLSSGQGSERDGIDLVERAASAAADAFRSP